MNTPDANFTRASLTDARVALGPMLGAAPAATGGGSKTMAERARDAWARIEALLQLLTGRSDLHGQELLSEARRVNALDMEATHALVAMREWTDRTMAPGSAAQKLTLPPTDAEREVARNVLTALERTLGGESSVRNTQQSSIPSPPTPAARSPWAPQATGAGSAPAPSGPSQWAPPRTGAPAASPATNYASALPAPARERSRFGATFAFVVIAAGLVAGAFFFLPGRGGPDSDALTEQGAAAYARGSKEAARLAFTDAIEKDPNDARALTYLGRIAREQDDLVKSRQFLERAIRAEPRNALALRELGAALLAANEYELARRFYVRSLEVDPNDKVSQGFLGCTLQLLGRETEALRWFERAGSGEWLACDKLAQPHADPPTTR